MKNIIIIGNCRAGKTLLATMLFRALPGFGYFGTDHMRSAIMHVLLPRVRNYETSPHVADFDAKWRARLVEINKNFLKSHMRGYNPLGKYFIMEGGVIKIDDVLEFIDNPNVLIVCVGKPGLSPTQYYNDIRKWDRTHHTWTSDRSDADIMRLAKMYSDESRRNFELCAAHGIMFVDTTRNQMRVLRDACDKIKKIASRK